MILLGILWPPRPPGPSGPPPPRLWLSLSVSGPVVHGRADELSLTSPSPQVQHKAGRQRGNPSRGTLCPFPASPCLQLSVPRLVILMNEEKETRGAARDATVIIRTWLCFSGSWRSPWPSLCLPAEAQVDKVSRGLGCFFFCV